MKFEIFMKWLATQQEFQKRKKKKGSSVLF